MCEMNDWLSVNRGIGMKLCLKYLAKRISHAPSTDANDPATSSDSMDDLVMRLCFFNANEIGEPQKVNIHPDVDFLSFESPMKSASVYVVMGCIYPVIPSLPICGVSHGLGIG